MTLPLLGGEGRGEGGLVFPLPPSWSQFRGASQQVTSLACYLPGAELLEKLLAFAGQFLLAGFAGNNLRLPG
jgi:hypothetical protein